MDKRQLDTGAAGSGAGSVEPGTGTRDGFPELPQPARTAIFLDFDGTLVEIADQPDGVVVPDGTEDLLTSLGDATEGAVALVSGRGLADLEGMLPGYEGAMVASHGAERRIRGERSVADQGAGELLRDARDELAAWSRDREGVLLEEKPASLVLHYRRAPEREIECRRALDAVAQRLPGFVVRPSKMSLELMSESVSKRAAVFALMETWRDRVPVAIGDDHTDEGMFEAVNALGGHGIKVGEGKTGAAHRLRDVGAVHDGLRRWLAAGGVR